MWPTPEHLLYLNLDMARALAFGRLVIAWGTLAAFILFGEAWLADLASMVKSTALLFWLFVVILWCAFGVVEQADHLSELLGEPLGTLVLTLSIVTVEVALIAAVMLDSHAGPALGRDTMFAVLMIVLNGVVGLALLLGGLRHGEQSYNLQGAVAYLAIIVPLSVIALVLPSFILSTSDGTLTKTQSFFFSLFTILLYGVFLAVQTIRNRTFFVEPLAVAVAEPKDNLRKYDRSSLGKVGRHALLLIVMILPIVLLAEQLAKLIDHGIAVLNAPPAMGGVLIALIVFTPEAMSALRAALGNQLQRTVNLCLRGFIYHWPHSSRYPCDRLDYRPAGCPWSRPSQHCPSRGHTRALHDHVLRTAHNHFGGRGASSTVLRLHRSDF